MVININLPSLISYIHLLQHLLQGRKVSLFFNQKQHEIRKLYIFNHHSHCCHGKATKWGALKA